MFRLQTPPDPDPEVDSLNISEKVAEKSPLLKQLFTNVLEQCG
jgi:hypothetical protein